DVAAGSRRRGRGAEEGAMSETTKTLPGATAGAATTGAGGDVASLVRADLRALPDYPAAEPGPCRWKLDQNESPWEPPRRVKEAAARALLAQPWSRYPDRDGAALRRRLGELHGWPAEGVLVGNGS